MPIELEYALLAIYVFLIAVALANCGTLKGRRQTNESNRKKISGGNGKPGRTKG